MDLKLIEIRAKEEIEKAKDLRELNDVFKKYLGKKGEITEILYNLSKLPKEKRAELGKETNRLKNLLRSLFEKKKEEIKVKSQMVFEKKGWIDVTRPGEKISVGHLHPLTKVRREIEEIFQSMGFSIIEGPEIENEWYNFDALNIPKDHPARDLWNTLWLKVGGDKKETKLLLRTHTSPVQIRYMEKNQPPLRIIVPGKVYRHEATDASHEFNLSQIEGLMVDKTVSVANFKAVIEGFFKKFLKETVKICLKPDYFPFTEPSFEVDVSCTICQGKGCPACGNSGWLEIMGAGMVHPNVFKNAGLNPKDWQGFAFGMGIERVAMVKYKIDNIRLFYSGDLRFLKQF